MSIKRWLGIEVNAVDKDERRAVINMHAFRLRDSADRLASLCYFRDEPPDKKSVLKVLDDIEDKTHRIRQLLNL